MNVTVRKERRWDRFARLTVEDFRRKVGHGGDAHRIDPRTFHAAAKRQGT